MKCSDCGKRITVGTPISLVTANRKWVHKRCWYRRENWLKPTRDAESPAT